MMNNIVIDCPLCSQHSLHIRKSPDMDSRQCINCGFATNDNLKGKMEDNEMYNKFSDFIKKHSKESGEHIWFPTMINLPIGSLYPVEKNGELKWAYVKMVDISEEEQKENVDATGEPLTKKLDYDNQEIFDEYIFGLAKMRDEAKSVNG